MNVKKLTVVLLLIAVLGTGFAVLTNSRSRNEENGRLTVAASYYPLYEFARQVGGDKVRAINITPAGAEPHDYEPTPGELADVHKSAVFMYNGSGLEPWAAAFAADYKGRRIKASDAIPLRDGGDPHFWLDPVLAKTIVETIRRGLSSVDPVHTEYYAARAASYTAQLDTLDDAFRRGLHTCRHNTVISSHEAFGYLAARYGFTVQAIAGVSPEEEPSAARLAELSDLVRDKNLRYIFFESLVSPRLADTIAAETGAKTLVFDPIEGLSSESHKKGKDYLSIQRQNLANLRTALACD